MGAYLEIDNTALETFSDESIVLTRKAADVSDLAAPFGDFTQSFDLPATDTNNKVFSHYYDIDIVDVFNPHVKVEARLMENTLEITSGVIELVDVTFKDGQPLAYQVVFYGTARGLSAAFGDDTLRDLDLSAYNHIVSEANVTNSWAGTLLSGNIVYPLIDYHAGVVWGTSNANVPTNIGIFGRGFSLDEMRPAIKVKALAEACAAHIGYTLGEGLLDDTYFTNLYVLPMNAGGIIADPQYNTKHTATGTQGATGTLTAPNFSTLVYAGEVDPGNNLDHTTGVYTAPMNGQYKFTFTYQLTSLTAAPNGQRQISFAVFKNNTFYTLMGNDTSPTGTGFFDVALNMKVGDTMQIKYNCVEGAVFSSYEWDVFGAPYGVGGQTVTISELMPEWTIKKFVLGLLETFNAVIYTSGTELYIVNKTEWLDAGPQVDYTPYIDLKSAQHKKLAIPSTITMAHEATTALTSENFESQNQRAFGSVSFVPNVDFSEGALTVQSPFNIMVPQVLNEVNSSYQKVRETDLRIYHFLDKDNKAVKQEMTLFFCNPSETTTTANEYYLGGVLQTEQPKCGPFTEHPAATGSASLAFSLENDINGGIPSATLFSRFWATHISRLFSVSSRRVIMHAKLPIGEWLRMDLAQTVFIAGRRYKINQVDYNTLTNEATLDLYTYPGVEWQNATTSGTGDDSAVTFASDPVDPADENLIFTDTALQQLYNVRRFAGVNYVNTYQDISNFTNTLQTQLQAQQLIANSQVGNVAMEKTTRATISINTGVWTIITSYNTATGLNNTPFTADTAAGTITTSQGAFIRAYVTAGWESDQLIEIAMILNGAPVFSKIGYAAQAYLDIDKSNMFMASTDTFEVGIRLGGGSGPQSIDITKVRIELTQQP